MVFYYIIRGKTGCTHSLSPSRPPNNTLNTQSRAQQTHSRSRSLRAHPQEWLWRGEVRENACGALRGVNQVHTAWPSVFAVNPAQRCNALQHWYPVNRPHRYQKDCNPNYACNDEGAAAETDAILQAGGTVGCSLLSRPRLRRP